MPLFMFNFKNAYANELDTKTVRICAYVTKLNSEKSEYASFVARVTEADGKEVDFSVAAFTKFSPQISDGDIFVCDALLDSSELSLWYNDTTLKRQNILFNATIDAADSFEIIGKRESPLTYFAAVANEIGYKFDRIFSRDTSALAKALLLGDRYELSDVTVRDFRRSGISHILALSGTHLVLIVGFIMYFLKFIILSDKLRFITVALISLLTILLTGVSPSILRAGLMLIYYQAGYLLKNRSDIITALFATVTIIVIFDPYAILDTGLILSFAATFGIALFSNISRNITLRIFANPTELNPFKKIFKYCLDSLLLSFCAGVFVMLASVFIFDSISLISALTTLIFTPIIVTFMLTSAFSLIFASVPKLSALLTALSEFLADKTGELASYFSHSDGIVISTGIPAVKFLALLFIFTFTYSVIKNVRTESFAVFCFGFALVSSVIVGIQIYTPGSSHVCTISNESEDGIIISDGRHSTYIDFANTTSDMCVFVTDAVSSYNDSDIDVFMLTHYHFDHIFALKRISEHTIIRKLLLPVPENDTDKEYAAELESTANRFGIDFEYYNGGKTLDFNTVSVTPMPLERVPGSTHPRIALSIEKSGERIVYTAAYNEKCSAYKLFTNMLKDADYIIKGTHGPKADDAAMLSSLIAPECRFFIRQKEADEHKMLLKQTLLPHTCTQIASFAP